MWSFEGNHWRAAVSSRAFVAYISRRCCRQCQRPRRQASAIARRYSRTFAKPAGDPVASSDVKDDKEDGIFEELNKKLVDAAANWSVSFAWISNGAWCVEQQTG